MFDELPLGGASLELFNQLLVSGLILGSSYALLGVSLGIIYSTTRIFHFAHSAVYAASAYVAVVGVHNLALPLAAAVPLGLVAGVFLGLAIEAVAYREMRRVGSTLLVIFLVSLGLTIMTPNLLQIIFGPENKTLPGFPITTFNIGSVTFTNLDLFSAITAWVLIALVLVFMRRSRYGRAITAVRTNRDMAAAVGISPDWMYLLVFGVGSLLVSVSAILFTLGGVAFPTMGLKPVLISFIAVFLGGLGSTGGAALGGLVLGLATSLSGLWITSDLAIAVVFGLLFVLLIFRPQGLLGKAGV